MLSLRATGEAVLIVDEAHLVLRKPEVISQTTRGNVIALSDSLIRQAAQSRATAFKKGSAMQLRTQRPDLTNGVPRGLTGKYLKDQSIPQARWQPQEQIESHGALAYNPKNPEGKILLGAIGEKLVGYSDDRHIMTVAGNRSGKSVTVTANLFFYDGSAFLVDSKGELSAATAEARAAMGQDVHVLDPFGIVKGPAAKYRAQYNEIATLDVNSETVIEDALQIVDGQVTKSGSEKDPHWNESASTALLGFVLYTAFGDNVPEGKRNLTTVRKCVTEAKRQEQIDEERSAYILPRRIVDGIQHLRNGKHDDIAETIEASVRGLYEKSHDEMASVLSTMNRHTAYLDFRSMKKIMGGHDFSPRDLKRKSNSVTIYLVLPATRMASCNRWLRTNINQLIEAMEAETTVPRSPVLAVLDEFPVLGHMAALENAAGQIASFNIRMWYILQDWGQGEAIYGKRWESFAANVGVNQWFSNIDLKTCEYISKRLGKTPVLTMRQNDTSHDQRDKGLTGQSASKQLYDLLTSDEVARVFARSDPLKRQLIQIAGLDPMILQRAEWWNEDAPYAHYFEGVR